MLRLDTADGPDVFEAILFCCIEVVQDRPCCYLGCSEMFDTKPLERRYFKMPQYFSVV